MNHCLFYARLYLSYGYINKKNDKPKLVVFGPGDRIRTCGPVVPNHVLYQTEPHPDILRLLFQMN